VTQTLALAYVNRTLYSATARSDYGKHCPSVSDIEIYFLNVEGKVSFSLIVLLLAAFRLDGYVRMKTTSMEWPGFVVVRSKRRKSGWCRSDTGHTGGRDLMSDGASYEAILRFIQSV
jgi:hypothetical protein